jgi:prepilin-type N-terminal cleavage/methylation domain-containing protein
VTAVEGSFAVIIVGVLLILALSQHFSDGRRLHRLSQGRLNTKMRNKQKGFSLIELLIVVAIILIIASMAIPNLIRSKMAANEASAVASIRTINTSEVVYSSTYNVANGFSADLKSLGDGGTAGTCTATFVPTSAAASLRCDPIVHLSRVTLHPFGFQPKGWVMCRFRWRVLVTVYKISSSLCLRFAAQSATGSTRKRPVAC